MELRNKVNFYRALKVVFYCLGLPLFLFAVIQTSNVFMGEMPFAAYGGESDVFAAIRVNAGNTGLYGVWIALGVWAVIAAVQIILHFTVKGRRTRMFAAVSAAVIAMMLPVFIIDGVYKAKIQEIAENAPAGVVVQSYEEELAYYRTLTSLASSPTGKLDNNVDALIKSVEDFCRVYNVSYYAGASDGVAGNTANTPVTYYDLGIDKDGNGKLDRKQYDNKGNLISLGDEILIKKAPNGSGELVVDVNGVPTTYKDCFVVERAAGEDALYLWYRKSKMPTVKEGRYGEASYNANGLLSDGYLFGVQSALYVMEDYYTSLNEVNRLLGNKDFGTEHAKLIAKGLENQRTYYTVTHADEMYDEHTTYKQLYEREVSYSEDHSLTTLELNLLVGKLLSGISELELIDLLLKVLGDNGLGDIVTEDQVNTIMGKLKEGITIYNLIALISADAAASAESVLNFLKIRDTKLLFEKAPHSQDETDDDKPVIDPEKPVLHLGLFGGELFGNDYNKGFEMWFDETFTIKNIDEFINQLLGAIVGDSMGTVQTVLDLVLGLVGTDIQLFDENGKISLENLLRNLLDGLYWYQSPVLRPYWEFFNAENANPATNAYKLAAAFADYERANYEATRHGALVGSVLIGDSLGSGNYSADYGLADLTAVRQLRIDLSYKPTMYPLLAVRDMLLNFVTVVVLFMVLSYFMAEKQYGYESGKTPLVKKEKGKNEKPAKKNAAKDKQPKKQSAKAKPVRGGGEKTAFNQDKNNGKGVA